MTNDSHSRQSELSVEQKLTQALNYVAHAGIMQRNGNLEASEVDYETGKALLQELIISEGRKMAEYAIGENETEYSNLDGDAGYWEKHGRNGLRDEARHRLDKYIKDHQ